MNLLQLTNKIKEAADLHPLVNQVADGSIYEALNTGDVRYPISVVFSQSVVKEVRTIRYKYVLYFVDRLVGDNALEIQTTAISVIQQIINTIGNNVENISIATGYSIQPFTEKFADECAGAFVQFDIVSENVLGNCSYDEGGDQPILDSYVRKDEVKQSVIEGEALPISSGAVFTALQGISGDVEHDDTLNKNGNPDFLHITQAEKDDFTTASDFVEDFISNATDILYADLLALINNDGLIPGQNYRITDYTTTTVQADTRSAGHQFDIIVTADSVNKLNENARACLHEGDTYFNRHMIYVPAQGCNPFVYTSYANELQGSDYFYAWYDSVQDLYLYTLVENPVPGVDLEYGRGEDIIVLYGDGIASVSHIATKLEAWEIKYCIYNDTSRFAWADTVNGKGVIYYMKDENRNECPYDFKNIQFIRKLTDGYLDEDNGGFIYVYTFTWFDENDEVNDLSLIGNELTSDEGYKPGIFNNTIKETTAYSVSFERNTPLFALGGNVFLYHHSFDTGLFYGCFNNSLGINCNSNDFGDSCNSNDFGNRCSFNTFGSSCFNNTFGNQCNSNTFGNECHSNTFGNDCTSNMFGNGSYFNMFGNNSFSNTFGNGCYQNIFGNSCRSNTFGNECSYNTFGNYCTSNNFYVGTSGTIKKDYIRYIVLEDGCQYNNFYSTLTTSNNNYLQRIRIKGLDNDTPTDTIITLSEVNTNYEWVICYTSGGTLKQYCPDNNDTYKLEDTSVSTWAASTKYVDFAYEAQINIADLSEADFVNVVFGVNEAVSGNYAPAIEQYAGYILVFSKVNTAITIPTIEITKIDL